MCFWCLFKFCPPSNSFCVPLLFLLLSALNWALKIINFPDNTDGHGHHPTLLIKWVPSIVSEKLAELSYLLELGRWHCWSWEVFHESSHSQNCLRLPWFLPEVQQCFKHKCPLDYYMTLVSFQNTEMVVLSILYSFIFLFGEKICSCPQRT